ncbi:hypothetical protein OG277_40305 [Streptomyces phaeochromogenes]|nr:hypothetical protein OG277_40305 [Streptomyces phaeochromogenes]
MPDALQAKATSATAAWSGTVTSRPVSFWKRPRRLSTVLRWQYSRSALADRLPVAR